MMRKLFVMAMVVGLVGMGGLVRDARAGATIDLIFTGTTGAGTTGGSTIAAAAGDTLTMAVLMRNDQTLSVVQFNVNYDLPGPTDTLDVVSAFAWVGVTAGPMAANKFAPLSGPSCSNPGTVCGSFNSVIGVPPALPLPVFGGAFAAANPGGYQMGTITWVVNQVDPGTIVAAFSTGQGFFGAGGVQIPLSNLVLNPSVVNIPEPATAALLGLGLVGIMAVGRRRSRP